jgi:hypothetical protein
MSDDKPDTPWFVRKTTEPTPPELLAFLGDSVPKSIFSIALPQAIVSFNALFKQLNHPLRLKSSTQPQDKPDPAENSYGGADIWIEVADSFTFEVSGQKLSLDFKTDPFVRGRTQTAAWDFGKGARIRKAVILMKPVITSDSAPRPVGAPALKVLAVHELIHAIGLSKHTPQAGDLFEANPTIVTHDNKNPNKDAVRVRGGKEVPSATGPELFLLESTISRIKAIWP